VEAATGQQQRDRHPCVPAHQTTTFASLPGT
jgi:hypothetical protein